MSKLDQFKEFVKKNPNLVKYVKNNEMTWQKFYEIYDMYGEDTEVWKDYQKKEESVQDVSKTAAVGGFDLINWLKNIDIDSFQENINSVKRVVSVLQELGTKDTSSSTTSNYKPRPIYKQFEE